jgi:hypothetical protein
VSINWLQGCQLQDSHYDLAAMSCNSALVYQEIDASLSEYHTNNLGSCLSNYNEGTLNTCYKILITLL